MADFCGEGKEKWPVCSRCAKAAPGILRFVVFMAPSYMRAILSIHPLEIQLLSVVDVSYQMLSRWNGFAHGVLQTNSLLDSPLIVWDKHHADGFELNRLPAALFQLLKHNMQTNPIIRRFQSVLEYSHPKYGVPVLSSSVLDNILSECVAKNPVQFRVGEDHK
jgi:hypothetical protein